MYFYNKYIKQAHLFGHNVQFGELIMNQYPFLSRSINKPICQKSSFLQIL